jgi:hypothetical protein
MATTKVTAMDVKMGRVFRCANCEAKCDDDIKSELCSFICGQRQVKKTNYYCSIDCANYYARDTQRATYEQHRAKYESASIALSDLLRDTLKFKIKINGLFELVKYNKANLNAYTRLLSQENTIAELVVAWDKVKHASYELGEKLHEDSIGKGEDGTSYIEFPSYALVMEQCKLGIELSQNPATLRPWSID